ncbi:hypothetical protein [Leptospira alstonii]|uniref:Uncharacterized protein n=1 Tax=Leptospira alstonii serovar Pingchang str. 80-412 TaxID=1218564 RepID=T0FLS9_9LEPT|nr:hypothetical protein [Leptospira alstonii]EQA78715.1 hypothetical protein LEP1GSC193_1597 [Leptospira alstonii serovar Pingchang str. 80-412]
MNKIRSKTEEFPHFQVLRQVLNSYGLVILGKNGRIQNSANNPLNREAKQSLSADFTALKKIHQDYLA